MSKYTNSIKSKSGGYEMNRENDEEKEITLEEALKLYYDEPEIPEEEKETIDRLIREVEATGFKEKCIQLAREKELERKRKIRIGRLYIPKIACVIICVCMISAMGVYGYASFSKHIKGIEVNDLEDHSEVELEYNHESDPNSVYTPNIIEDYFKPCWVPEGYCTESEFKTDSLYSIIYKNESNELRIHFTQYLPKVKAHYSTEGGKHEKVSFGDFEGEYIETEDENFLIVTDGTYLYGISGYIDKDILMQMLNNDK